MRHFKLPDGSIASEAEACAVTRAVRVLRPAVVIDNPDLPGGKIEVLPERDVVETSDYTLPPGYLAGLKADELAELGIAEIQIDPRPNDRFYTDISLGEVELTWNKTPRPLATVKTELKGGVKSEARRIITASYPDWKQANLTARGVEFAFTLARGKTLTEQENTEADALLAVWGKIKGLRAHSDTLEAEIDALIDMPACEKWRSHDWPEL